MGRKTHTWKPPDQSSLHDFCKTGMRFIEAMQTFISSKDIHHARLDTKLNWWS